MINTLPKTTNKQKQIINLIYAHRFLNRKQIQALMGHKDYKTINLWLRDLRDKRYLKRIYSTDFAERTKPAIYYLGLNGIRYIKATSHPNKSELAKRYRDTGRAQSYIERSQLVGDIVISLKTATPTSDKYSYYWELESDYRSGYYQFLLEQDSLEQIRPNLCVDKLVDKVSEDPVTVTSYMLEIFDLTLPRYRVKKRLSNYVSYLNDGDWSKDVAGSKIPEVLIVCQRTTDLIFAKRFSRGLMNDSWDYDDPNRPIMKFALAINLKTLGFFGDIWETA